MRHPLLAPFAAIALAASAGPLLAVDELSGDLFAELPGVTLTEPSTAEFRAAPPAQEFGVAESTAPPHEQIADAYGFDKTLDVEAVRFVFNAQEGATHVRRDWEWDLTTNRVIYRGPDRNGNIVELAYSRDAVGRDKSTGELEKYVDEWFVHDQYWLLFPYHLIWDEQLEISYDGPQPLPIGPGEAERITVRYPEKGAMPGEEYLVYYAPTHLIQEWTYRPRGGEGRELTTTWGNHVKAGPLVLSLNHLSKDGNVRVWFEDVAVKPSGEDWAETVPLPTDRRYY